MKRRRANIDHTKRAFQLYYYGSDPSEVAALLGVNLFEAREMYQRWLEIRSSPVRA